MTETDPLVTLVAVSTRRPVTLDGSETYDLVIVGAGIVGLAHALEAAARGLRVVVVERDDRAVGASVRNFGHLTVTAQGGRARAYAVAARETWLSLAKKVGFPLQHCGTTVVARTANEMGVLEELVAERGAEVVLLDREGVADNVPSLDAATVGGAHFPLDLVTDPRAAVAAITDWLATEGVPMHFGTAVLGVEAGVVRTTRGTLRAAAVVVAVGHDVDYLMPEVAAAIDLRRCSLEMLEVDPPPGGAVRTAVLSGLSMLRYAALSSQPSATAVRAEITAGATELVDVDMNLMLTSRPDGRLVIGDTHASHHTTDPFTDERLPSLILRETARLLGVERLQVRRRWRGVYATSSHTDYLVASPSPGVHVVSVTSGIGMTTSFGLAPEVLDTVID